jgi:hypothetical protein
MLINAQCIAGQCLVIPQVHYGAGKHVDYIDPDDFVAGLRLNLISQPVFLFAICFVKISVGFFLLRIAVGRFYRRLIIGIMGKSAQFLDHQDEGVDQFQGLWVFTQSAVFSRSSYSALISV